MGWENEVKWMKTCERLLTDLIESNYWKDEYDNKPLNLRNIEYNQFWKDIATPQNGVMADLREVKAKALLFKILSWRIDYWWD